MTYIRTIMTYINNNDDIMLQIDNIITIYQQ